MVEQRAYLSIEGWPAGLGEAARADVMRRFLDVDEHRARDLARRRTPSMLGRFPMDRGARIAQELTAAGIPALAVPGAVIAKHADPWLARGIFVDPVNGGLSVTRWRDGRDECPARSIVLLVRAHCRDHLPGTGGDFGVQALHQLHGTFSAQDWNQGPTARGRLRLIEVLDVHTIEGPHWRFLGGRYTSSIPGPAPAPTAVAQLEALTRALARLAGGRPVDTGFSAARFLAEFAPDFGVQGDWRSLSGFGVYSAWLRCLVLARQTA